MMVKLRYLARVKVVIDADGRITKEFVPAGFINLDVDEGAYSAFTAPGAFTAIGTRGPLKGVILILDLTANVEGGH